jgi:undecaprenyl-diphosphatase
MTIFQALVLGVLQGLTEFLPVSSSAHLTLAPRFLGWSDPGLAFDVALHVGTLVALLWYFRTDWIALLVAAWRLVTGRRVRADDRPPAREVAPGGIAHPTSEPTTADERRLAAEDERRVLYLVVATIPAAIGGLLLEDYAETVFRAPAITAVALITMGALLWAVDRAASQDRPLGTMRWTDALLVGLAQVVALVPGVSRSGATITAGRALRFDRTAAARFSFLMSMPVIAAAAVLKVPQVLREGGLTPPLAVGVVAAALSSWLAIAILLRYVSRHSYGVFAAYRLVLGALVLTLLARA